MNFPLLTATEPRDIEYHSSISQNSGGLVVWAGGEYRPVVFDQILGIDCDHIITRKVWVAPQGYLGYNYPVGGCHYITDTYALFDDHREIVEQLPEWFGAGFYKKMVAESALANLDNGSVGVRNKHRLRLGYAYAMAKETLPAVE